MHISFICSNQEMRISSFLVLAKEYANELSVVGYDCIDDTRGYVEKLGHSFFNVKKENWYHSIDVNKFEDKLLVINLDQKMTLEKLKNILNSQINNFNKSKILLKDNNNENSKKLIKQIENISWIYFDKLGFENYISNENEHYFNNENIKIDVEIKEKSIINKKEVLKNKKRDRNPLIIFGIPGLIMIVSSFILVYNVIGKYDSIDSVSMGTAIITIATTLLGILSLMSGIISYFLGKQTEFIFTNYSE